MLGGPYEFVRDAAPTRTVGRALLAVPWKTDADGAQIVVVDADTEELALVPGLPADQWEQLALAGDGTRLLVRTWQRGLCLYTLATGQQRWYTGDDGSDFVAALSPDGRTIATLCLPEDPTAPVPDTSLSALNLVDISTGRRQRLWATRGAWSMESAVSWSPDGQMIALTHTVPVPELGGQHNWNTTVVDLTGAVVWQCLDAAIPPASNGAWVGDRELAFTLDDMDAVLAVVDVRDGTRRVIGRAPSIPYAVVGERVLRNVRYDLGQPGDWVVSVTDLDGDDARPFLTTTPGSGGFNGDRLDIARR